MADHDIELGLDANGVNQGAEKAAQAVGKIGEAAVAAKDDLEKVETASVKSSARMQAGSRAALQASQALQDVVQGGLASALNNVDSIVFSLSKSLGVSAAAATAFSAATLGIGTALLVGVPLLKSFYGYITEETGKLPASTDKLGKYNDELKVLKDRLEDIKERDGTLSTKEIDDYEKGVKRLIEIEDKLAKAKNAGKAKLSLEALIDPVEEEYVNKRTEVLKDRIGGQGKELIAAVKKSLEEASPELKAQWARIALIEREYQNDLSAGIITDEAAKKKAQKAIDAQKKVIEEIKTGIEPEAANLLEDAILKGNEGSAKKIVDLLGPDSELGKAITSGLKATKDHFANAENEFIAEAEKKDQEAWDKLAKNVTKVTGDFYEKYKQAITKGAEEARKTLEEEDKKQREAENHAERQRAEQEARMDKFRKEDQPKAEEEKRKKKKENTGKIQEAYENTLIRDVFYENSSPEYYIDENGRQKAKQPVMTAEQVKQARGTAKEYQQAYGLDDKSAAQLAIQEQQLAMQQAQADKAASMDRRLQRLGQGVQTLPDLMQWGSGY